jgi:hypothetical protein
MKSINNDYTYGLESKINDGIDNNIEELKKDIKWLINDCILKNNIYFYESAKNIICIKVWQIRKKMLYLVEDLQYTNTTICIK